jgi:hypothetical protein
MLHQLTAKPGPLAFLSTKPDLELHEHMLEHRSSANWKGGELVLDARLNRRPAREYADLDISPTSTSN